MTTGNLTWFPSNRNALERETISVLKTFLQKTEAGKRSGDLLFALMPGSKHMAQRLIAHLGEVVPDRQAGRPLIYRCLDAAISEWEEAIKVHPVTHESLQRQGEAFLSGLLRHVHLALASRITGVCRNTKQAIEWDPTIPISQWEKQTENIRVEDKEQPAEDSKEAKAMRLVIASRLLSVPDLEAMGPFVNRLVGERG